MATRTQNTNSIRDLMTRDPFTLDRDRPITEAARAMRDQDVGPIIVTKDNNEIAGIVTDRDLVIRGLTEAKDPSQIKIGDVCTGDCITVEADAPVDEAIALMRDRAIRRLPVVEGGKPVGILSLGDLAVERDPQSVLGEISSAPPNN